MFTTSDRVKIVGDYYAGTGSAGVLLLHMMPATRGSWREFVPRLLDRSWHVLAIDLRGHGESEGGPDGYKKFSDGDHQASIRDCEAGIAYLEEQGVLREELTLVGASIGANLALQCLAECGDIPQGVVLSAGLDYHGVATAQYVEHLLPEQRVLFASSEDDGSNGDENRTLYELVPEGVGKKIVVYTHAGHGTDMFDREDPDLAEEILCWLG